MLARIVTAIPATPMPSATPAAITPNSPLQENLTAKTNLRILGNTRKRGSLAAPPFANFAVSSRKRRKLRVFSGDAHRKSGVFSVRAALSPVESCSPPELRSSRLRFTPVGRTMQAKSWRIWERRAASLSTPAHTPRGPDAYTLIAGYQT
jgi:hypothetical protein